MIQALRDVWQSSRNANWTYQDVGKRFAWGLYNAQSCFGSCPNQSLIEKKLLSMGALAYRTWNHANEVLSPGRVKFIKYSGICLLIPYIIATFMYQSVQDENAERRSQAKKTKVKVELINEQSLTSRKMAYLISQLVAITNIFLSYLEFRKRPMEVAVEIEFFSTLVIFYQKIYQGPLEINLTSQKAWSSAGHFVPLLLLSAERIKS